MVMRFWTWIVGFLAFLAMLATGIVARYVVVYPTDTLLYWALLVLSGITLLLMAAVVYMVRQWPERGDYFTARGAMKFGSGALPRGVAGRDPTEG